MQWEILSYPFLRTLFYLHARTLTQPQDWRKMICQCHSLRRCLLPVAKWNRNNLFVGKRASENMLHFSLSKYWLKKTRAQYPYFQTDQIVYLSGHAAFTIHGHYCRHAHFANKPGFQRSFIFLNSQHMSASSGRSLSCFQCFSRLNFLFFSNWGSLLFVNIFHANEIALFC